MVKQFIKKIKCAFFGKSKFKNSSDYWEERYKKGRDSGAGSYNNLAAFKAKVLNQFVKENQVKAVIEFGCGDGNQLMQFNFPKYTGFDVSETIINRVKSKFKNDESKKFFHISQFENQRADLVLSLDVIYHLVENDVFENYMNQLFKASNRFVIIYSSNFLETDNQSTAPHVKHRKFTDWIELHMPKAQLRSKIKNDFPFDGDNKTSSKADFYIYELG